MLGTGVGNSPVLGAGKSGSRTVFKCGCIGSGGWFFADLIRASSAKPLPKQPNAGINIQNHQTAPAGANLATRSETIVKATPIVMLRIASSILGSRLRLPLRV